MTVVIVEDESGAVEHLRALLAQYNASIRIQAILRSVAESVDWFASHPHPDLGLFDIQLNDGLSFEIFQKVDIYFPIIFTTAFNQYAIHAFRVNSIDYLLKPLKAAELARALNKHSNLQVKTKAGYESVIREMERLKERELFTLLVSQRDKLVPIPAAEFSYFHIVHGLLHGTANGKMYTIGQMTMDDLHDRLDARWFFRVSRQCIVNRGAIADIQIHFHSRLALRLNPPAHETITVSKARVQAFKAWLTSGAQ